MMKVLPAVLLAAFVPALAAQAPADDAARLRELVVARHAGHCHALYGRCAEQAALLLQAVDALLAKPGDETLQAARTAWCRARVVYGESEALRFQAGPIEELEPLLNAWPVDEAYVDHVIGRPEAGIVHDTKQFPVLAIDVLEVANERGSETNVSVGWHTIEFLLWGQDTSATGPGERSFRDFVVGEAPHADRRGRYLRLCTARVAEHLRTLHLAWAPDAPARRAFVADANAGVRRLLTGTAVLSAFELCGERLAVAYETKDQEQEHSCFSDTTWHDLQANQRGIVAVLGTELAPDAPTPMRLLRSRDADAADHLATAIAATSKALAAIPQPFDQAFLGKDDAKGRVAIRAAMEALEQQAEAIAIAGRVLGYELPMRPGH